MDIAIRSTLKKLFNPFAAEVQVTTMQREARAFLGRLPKTALSKGEVSDLVGFALSNNFMEPYQALSFMSANVLEHEDSGYNEHEYLQRAIALYNAKGFSELCAAENIKKGSKRFHDVEAAYSGADALDENIYIGNKNRTERLKNAKMHCYVRDIIHGTQPSYLMRAFGADRNSYSLADIRDLLSQYNPKPRDKKRIEITADGQALETTSAFDLQKVLPKLKMLRASGVLTEAQCGLFLCYTLHSMERRKKDDSCYTDHPMAVAGLVQKFGPSILRDDELVWKSTLVALLHDIGEKNKNFDVRRDLKGLVSDDVAAAVALLHKADDQPYLDFIVDISKNRLASVVKLCDIVHNSSDYDKSSPTASKQEFVYPLSAAYLRASLEQSESLKNFSMKDFAVLRAKYSQQEFERIQNIAIKDSVDKGEGLVPRYPPVKEDVLTGFGKFGSAHANARGKEDVTLHLRPDV